MVAGEGNPIASEQLRRLRTASGNSQLDLGQGPVPLTGQPPAATPEQVRWYDRDYGYPDGNPNTLVAAPSESASVATLRQAARRASAADVASHHVGANLGPIPTPQTAVAAIGQGRPELNQGVTNRNAQAQLVNPLQQERSVLPVAGAETQQPAAMRQVDPSKFDGVGTPSPVATTTPTPPRTTQLGPTDAMPSVRSNAGDIIHGMERSNPAGTAAIEASQRMTLDPASMPMQTDGGNSRTGGSNQQSKGRVSKEQAYRMRKARQAAARAADTSGWSALNVEGSIVPDIPGALEKRAFHTARRMKSPTGRWATLAAGKLGARGLRALPVVGAVAGTALSAAQGMEEAGPAGAVVQGGFDLAGTAAGAAIGAGLGSAGPIVGTAAGAVIGSIVGGFGGSAAGSAVNSVTADAVAKSKVGAGGLLQGYGQMMDPFVDTELEKADIRRRQVEQSAIGRELKSRKRAEKARQQADMAEMALLNYTV